MSDMDLLQEYAQRKSEWAFAALTERHVNLVYSAALRQVRDPHLAEEVTQTVFVILARKAGSLSGKTILAGWLCQTARYAAAKAQTGLWRRQRREHQAFMENATQPEESSCWTEIEPELDSALGELSRKDHDALVVRFLDGRSFKEAAAALGTTEAGAKMRVNRALEKLRGVFARRGIHMTAGIIGAAMSANAVHAAPLGLAAGATAAAVTGAKLSASTCGLIESTIKIMAWQKAKTAAVMGAAALLTVGTGTFVLKSTGSEPTAAAPAAKAAYATPEASLRTLIGALKEADTKKFAEGCTPERAQLFNERNASKTEEELKREAAGMAKAFSTFKIVSKKSISADEVHLHVAATGDLSQSQRGDQNTVMRMRRIAGEWKFDGNVQ